MTALPSEPTKLTVNDRDYAIYRLDSVAEAGTLTRLPFSLKILLENLLRHADGDDVTRQHIDALLDCVENFGERRVFDFDRELCQS